MVVKACILTSCYQDSVVLMRIAGDLRREAAIHEAGLFMGTDANKDLLKKNGLLTPEGAACSPEDLIIAVEAEDEAAADKALEQAKTALQTSPEDEGKQESRPRTLEAAVREQPGANLAFISLPGQYAAREARKALNLGLNVFLFSDNVSLDDEIALKKLAASRGLFCMGPDCGSSCINGTRLGFMNVIPRGRIGLVASSGTGLQAVTCHLAAYGEGVSQAVGVGGRDLTAEVGGIMTREALTWIAEDKATELIILVTKQCAPSVLADLDSLFAQIRVPVVVCGAGTVFPDMKHATVVDTLDAAAEEAVRILGGRKEENPASEQKVSVEDVLAASAGSFTGVRLIGLYTGGTLAHEAASLLERDLAAPVRFGAVDNEGNGILDLGDDVFTVGRPHPMIDPSFRNRLILGETSELPELFGKQTANILLLDLVLGDGSHANPAEELASSVQKVREQVRLQGGELFALCSIVGTSEDRQNLFLQQRLLEEAGVLLFASNAKAVHFAASLFQAVRGA